MQAIGARVHGIFGMPAFLFWTGVAGFFIALGALQPWDTAHRWGTRSLALIWGRVMWWAIPFWGRDWHGLENLGEGPYIIVSNHQSTIDIPCLYGLPTRLKVSGGPIFRYPIMGYYARLAGQVDTRRFFEDGRAALADGYSLLVFPEGGRSRDGEVMRFRTGAARLALEAGIPILPIVVDHSRFIQPPGTWWPSKLYVRVQIRVLEAFQPQGEAKAVSDELRHRIADELERMRRAN